MGSMGSRSTGDVVKTSGDNHHSSKGGFVYTGRPLIKVNSDGSINDPNKLPPRVITTKIIDAHVNPKLKSLLSEDCTMGFENHVNGIVLSCKLPKKKWKYKDPKEGYPCIHSTSQHDNYPGFKCSGVITPTLAKEKFENIGKIEPFCDDSGIRYVYDQCGNMYRIRKVKPSLCSVRHQ